MNVKISYTVDLEEIPEEMNKIIDKVYETLDQILLEPMPGITKDNINGMLEQIDNVRKKLFKIDTNLSDCYNILSAYNKAISSPQPPQEESGQADESD